MGTPLLTLQNIELTFGGTPLFEDAGLSVSEGDRICIVGRNGSGKSTLIKIAAGLIEPDRGKRFVQPGVTLRYLPQEPDFDAYNTVLSYVESGLGPSDDPYQARLLLGELELSGEASPSTLSGGEARRAALAKTLAPNPDVLLLDEPTNHLDIQVIEWLERRLGGMRSAMLLISHDRRFLTNLSRATVWVDRGRTRAIDIGFGAFETWRDEALAQEELERHKLARRIEREADWLRYGVTARRKRNVRRLAALHAMRDEKRNAKRSPGHAKLEAADGALSGKLVIEAKGISKSFGDKPIVDGFSIRIHRGDRVGVAGPNGAGKTTLLTMLIGKMAPDTGVVRLGANLEVASLEQSRDSLKPEWTVANALTGGGDLVVINGVARHVAAYMQDFLFLPEQVRTPVKALSGGERARLMLARALAKPSNLLVLDEPTNDLDLETLDVLEEMLADYAGTLILISHDRDFLDRIATSIIVPEGDGRWIEYAGGYSDMIAQRGGGPLSPDAPVKTGKPIPTAAKEKPVGSGDPKAKRRLSFNEKHALETLPAKMTGLEKEIGDLQNRLANPALYAKDAQAFEKASAALVHAQNELAQAENRWLELELLREEFAGPTGTVIKG
jgi:ABC transport system ATP-binding/permease protein